MTDKKLNIELKPCPFCGEKPLIRRDRNDGSLNIECPNCSKSWNSDDEVSERWASDFSFYGWDKSSDGAVIAAWNRRAADRPTTTRHGKFKTKECERDALQLNDWAGEVARAKWLHIVTANHLRKARKTIRELRKREDELQKVCDVQSALLYAYRGCNATTDPNASVPEHYQGDGYVTCDRAMEAASAQRCIVDRPPLNYWYWATAFKYVWRMWSKAEPVSDARKAIDCLEKAAGICRAVELDG